MHVLFVHQNYPAQFGYIARRLAKDGMRCTFISERPPGNEGGVRRIQYEKQGGSTQQTHYLSRSFENFTWQSHAVYEKLRSHREIRPDIVVGHSGFGSALFLADLYDCPIVNLFEWYYQREANHAPFLDERPHAKRRSQNDTHLPARLTVRSLFLLFVYAVRAEATAQRVRTKLNTTQTAQSLLWLLDLFATRKQTTGC